MKPSQVPLSRTIDKRVREKLDEYDNILGKGLYQLPYVTSIPSSGGVPFKPVIYTNNGVSMRLYCTDASGKLFYINFTAA